jgi:predicted nucleic-acid-binding protein
MVALDTNVLVRWFIADDFEQTKAAELLFAEETVFISTTVLLETEWVLRDALSLSREDINAKFNILMSLEHCVVAEEAAVLEAVEWHADGLDFADALHLSLSRSSDSFATFDSRLRKRAAKLEGAPKVIAP